mgnify:FL=1
MRVFYIIIVLIINFQCFSQSFEQSTDSINIYIKKREYLKALNLSRKKSNEYLRKKNHANFCEITLLKSKIYFLLNDKEKSFENLFQVLKLTEEHNLTKLKIQTLEEIGHRYFSIFDYEKAKVYYHRSLYLGKKNNLLAPNSYIYQRMYALHFTIESDSAFYYLEKVRIGTLQKGNNLEFAVNYNNYYSYYSSQEKYSIARKYLDSALIYAEKSNNATIITTVLSNFGYHYLVVEKDYEKAVDEYQKIILLNPQDTISTEMADVFINISYGYEMLGDYKNAHDYFNRYNTLTQNIYQGNLKQAINDVETKYRIEKIENENREKQQIFEEKQKNNHKIILIFIALFAFSTILFYFFYQNLRLKQKNKFIDLDRQVKQNIINASMDGQEIERKNIANILHDSISALLSSSGLHLSAYIANNPEEKSEEIQKAREILKQAHDNVRDLSHELLPPLLAKFGLFHAVLDLSEKNSNSILHFEYSSYVADGRRYSEEFEMRIYFIITELFNNIMKHSNASKAFITFEEIANRLLITIEDDGKGFNSSKENSSDGCGLTQMKSIIKHLKVTININSKINAGTSITINLPVPK